LLRPGRLDRLVYLGISPSDRMHILAAQIRKLRLEDDPQVLATSVVDYLPENLTGADLSTIATGAQLIATERLCAQVDAEILYRRRIEGTTELTIDRLLESWDENRLQPIVVLDDLLKASQTVTPSVSTSELENYERIRHQFHR
jgi:peroxin-6